MRSRGLSLIETIIASSLLTLLLGLLLVAMGILLLALLYAGLLEP